MLQILFKTISSFFLRIRISLIFYRSQIFSCFSQIPGNLLTSYVSLFLGPGYFLVPRKFREIPSLFNLYFSFLSALLLFSACNPVKNSDISEADSYPDAQFINQKGDGFMGIWYMNQPLGPPYEFKYSGGMGTYCAKHRPFAIYSEEVNKTFFVFGGTQKESWKKFDVTQGGGDRDTIPGMLLHMISFFDHNTGEVARPTILMDKMTRDAHDNPVITIDNKGFIWVFSTAHGTMRRSYIHRSEKAFDISSFKHVDANRKNNGETVPLDNFSYFQIWYGARDHFLAFFTHYEKNEVSGLGQRVAYFMNSQDGVNWSEWKQLAAISQGHYQISEYSPVFSKAGTALNYHPKQEKEGEAGLNYRTNLYYLETHDNGTNWQSVDGKALDLPLTTAKNPALIKDFESEGLKIYLKDIAYDQKGQPVILYISSKGYQSGPENGPYNWEIAYWNGEEWGFSKVSSSDHNYDMGSIFLEDDAWRIVAPTDTGAQAYNPGGEMVSWISKDNGLNWEREKTLTSESSFNHTYARRTVNAHPGFYAFWADGHGRKPSISHLYFSDKEGNVFQLPEEMESNMKKPIQIR